MPRSFAPETSRTRGPSSLSSGSPPWLSNLPEVHPVSIDLHPAGPVRSGDRPQVPLQSAEEAHYPATRGIHDFDGGRDWMPWTNAETKNRLLRSCPSLDSLWLRSPQLSSSSRVAQSHASERVSESRSWQKRQIYSSSTRSSRIKSTTTCSCSSTTASPNSSLVIGVGWTTEEQVDILCERAGGLFIHAVATVRFVDHRSNSPKKQLDRLLQSQGAVYSKGRRNSRPTRRSTRSTHQFLRRPSVTMTQRMIPKSGPFSALWSWPRTPSLPLLLPHSRASSPPSHSRPWTVGETNSSSRPAPGTPRTSPSSF